MRTAAKSRAMFYAQFIDVGAAGWSGTGKEVPSADVHRNSPRQERSVYFSPSTVVRYLKRCLKTCCLVAIQLRLPTQCTINEVSLPVRVSEPTVGELPLAPESGHHCVRYRTKIHHHSRQRQLSSMFA